MEFEEIKLFSYEKLIRNLPNIVYSYASSIRISTASHVWHRLNRRKRTIIASIPHEIEQYIINRIKCVDELRHSNINFGLLIHIYWHVSHRPFEIAIAEIMNICILDSNKRCNNNINIIVENIRRNRNRFFNPLYSSDMAWVLSVYLNKKINGSRIISLNHKIEKYIFSEENNFPIEYNCKKIIEEKNSDIFLCIKKYFDAKYILYICEQLSNDNLCYNQFENKMKEYCEKNQLAILIWELKPILKHLSLYQNIKYVQGFSEENYIEVEKNIDLFCI
jgi:hypothetical protein